MSNNKYTPELKEKVLRLYLEEVVVRKVLPKNTILVKVLSHTGCNNAAKNANQIQLYKKKIIPMQKFLD